VQFYGNYSSTTLGKLACMCQLQRPGPAICCTSFFLGPVLPPLKPTYFLILFLTFWSCGRSLTHDSCFCSYSSRFLLLLLLFLTIPALIPVPHDSCSYSCSSRFLLLLLFLTIHVPPAPANQKNKYIFGISAPC
jgi:hypothetical protein